MPEVIGQVRDGMEFSRGQPVPPGVTSSAALLSLPTLPGFNMRP